MSVKKQVTFVCISIILMIIIMVVIGQRIEKMLCSFQRDIPEMPIKEYTHTDVRTLALL